MTCVKLFLEIDSKEHMLSIMIPGILRARQESGTDITPEDLKAVRAEAFAQATMGMELGLQALLEDGGPNAPGLRIAISLVRATAAGTVADEVLVKMRSGPRSEQAK